MQNPRILCAEILQAILEDKVFFSDLKEQIKEENRAFANQLVLGALRYFVPLNKILARFIKKKIPHKHRSANYLLLLAIYELAEMKTPQYAVLNTTVKNVRTVSDSFLAGMANAVLRNVCKNLENIKSDMAQMSKIPPEFKEILKGYEKEQIKKIADCLSAPAPVDLTVKNNHKIRAEKLNAKILPNGTLRLESLKKISQAEGFVEGCWWVQDVAASLPALTAGNLCGKTVADLCAAPGGKTAQLALTADKVFAFDISASRLERLKENMARLHLSEKVVMINADAAEYCEKNPQQKFDVVLLDAPCSATGTMRRHPEVLHIKTTEDVKAQVSEQRKLLKAAANSLKKGGILIYSVCSIAKAEGEEQIERFLNENDNFKVVKITDDEISAFGKWTDELIYENGMVRTLPFYAQNIGGMDAFFICKLQKIN